LVFGIGLGEFLKGRDCPLHRDLFGTKAGERFGGQGSGRLGQGRQGIGKDGAIGIVGLAQLQQARAGHEGPALLSLGRRGHSATKRGRITEIQGAENLAQLILRTKANSKAESQYKAKLARSTTAPVSDS
jgi:hypothetical protein